MENCRSLGFAPTARRGRRDDRKVGRHGSPLKPTEGLNGAPIASVAGVERCAVETERKPQVPPLRDRSVPGFPVTWYSPTPACAAFSKESRMKSANATKLDRKSGVAEWRDLRFTAHVNG